MTHIEFERAITQCCVPMIWLALSPLPSERKGP